MVSLIDADLLLYRAMFKFIEGEPEYSTVGGETFTFGEYTSGLEEAKIWLKDFITELGDVLAAKGTLLAFSDRYNFRKLITNTYKSNRKELLPEQREFLGSLRTWMCKKWSSRSIRYLEADDLMGILATGYPGDYKICSIDKDLLQIPGQHYNWNTQEEYEVSPEEGEYQFYTQVLTGDSTDGYLGCRGVGPVKAKKYLDLDCSWEGIKEIYRQKGQSAKDALETAWLAKILTREDYEDRGVIHLYKGPQLYIS